MQSTCALQVGMPVMRSDGGKLRLGVVLGSEREARELSVAIATGSRLLPGAQVSAQDCRCADLLALAVFTCVQVVNQEVVLHCKG